MKLSILYIGPDSGTSRHRALALRRLGHDLRVLDPRSLLPGSQPIDYWIHHTGALLLEHIVRQCVFSHIPSEKFDLVWVDQGGMLDSALIAELKRRFGPVLNYNADDPYGNRDGRKWRLYLRAVPHYDLIVVVREVNVAEAYAAGARDVLRVSRSADEVAHSPRYISEEDRRKWASDVAFIGTWMPERGPFLARLVQLGVPLAIYGDNWDKANEWPALRHCWRGNGLYDDDQYAKAVQCAKVCLGLLSKGNRDLSTTRSFEIPYLSGVFCAERTPEHLALYEEDVEAAFWSSPEECAEKCRLLLKMPEVRANISERGRLKCIENQTLNQPVIADILDGAMS